MAKEPSELKWLENLLPEEEFRRRSMFGGFAYSLDEKMILATFESRGSKSYKNKTYDFELWNGCMFPVEKEFQEKALRRFPFLVNHPILPKWLYLPLDTEGFDDLVSEVLSEVTRSSSFWGSIPTKKKSQRKTKEAPVDVRMDTRIPRMFSDEPAQEALSTAKKLSDLKNIGPVLEAEMHRAGIKTAPAFIKMGWKKAFQKMGTRNPKYLHTMVAYTLIGAIHHVEWNRISEEQKLEAKELSKKLRKPKKK